MKLMRHSPAAPFCSTSLLAMLPVVLIIATIACDSFGQAGGGSAVRREHVDRYGDPLPDGALARLGTLRFRTGGRITGQTIAFVPGQQLLVAASPKGGIGFWHPASGRLLRELHVPGLTVNAFAISPDGTRIATLAHHFQRESRESTTQLHVWLVQTGEEQSVIRWVEPMQEQSRRLAFTPGGQSVATGGRDGTVRIWDLASRQELLNHQTVGGEVESIAFSPDGEVMAIASRFEVGIWRWLEGGDPDTLLRRQEGHRGAMSVAFSPDGRWLATGSDELRGIRVWDVATRRLHWRIKRLGDEIYYPERIVFTPDSEMLAVPVGQRGQRLELRDVASGKFVRGYDTAGVDMRHAAVSSDQQWLAGFGHGHAIHVWRLSDGQAQHEKFIGHYEEVYQLEFTPDGQKVLTAPYGSIVRAWEPDTGKPLQRIKHDTRTVASIDVSPDGKYLGTTAFDRTNRIWELDTGREVYNLLGHARSGAMRANVVAFHPDGDRFLSFGSDMFLRIWQVANGKAIEEHDIRPIGLGIARSETGEIISPTRSYRLRGPAVRKALFTPDCEHLLLHLDDAIIVLETATGKEVRRFVGRFDAVETSLDNTVLATVETRAPGAGGSSKFVRLREFLSGEVLRDIPLPAASRVRVVKFGPLNQLALTASQRHDDGSYRYFLSIIDMDTDERTTVDHGRGMMIGFSPDGGRLAVSYADTTVLVWDIEHLRR